MLAADNMGRLCGGCLRDRRDQLRTPPVLGDDFWNTDDLCAAFESQHMGRVFRAYRNHVKHLELFGKALNQELLGRWLGLTQAQVSKLENGKPEQNLETLRAYAEILHIPHDMLWFDFPGQTKLAARPDRVDFVGLRLGSALAITPPTQVLRPPHLSTPMAIDQDPLVRISGLVDARTHFERMYRNSGGLVARVRIEQFMSRQALSIVTGLGGASAEIEYKSKRAMGSLVALAGVCAYDSEDWATANSYFAQALAIAEMSNDYGFHSYVLALMVNQALALEDYGTAESLATVALRSGVKAPASPLIIDLQVMRAKALASMGDKPAAMSVIRDLESAVVKPPQADGMVEASYAQEGHLQAQLAEALISLGDLRAARRYAEQSLVSDGHARGKVNRLASMASLEVARGEIERASSLASEMIENAQGMESRRLNSRFIKLRAELARGSATVSREAIGRIDSAIRLVL